jgi:hypothetical protein
LFEKMRPAAGAAAAVQSHVASRRRIAARALAAGPGVPAAVPAVATVSMISADVLLMLQPLVGPVSEVTAVPDTVTA